MKRLILFLVPILFCLASLRAQTWTHINGRYMYDFLKIDSLVYLPFGNTANRPAPVSGAYWLRFNTDSSAFEYSNGTSWLVLALKPPADYYYIIYPDTKTRDTTIALSCGTVSTPYSHYSLPQFIGFRTRVYSGASIIPGNTEGACLIGPFWSSWNSSTGDLWVYGVGIAGGSGSLDLQITAY